MNQTEAIFADLSAAGDRYAASERQKYIYGATVTKRDPKGTCAEFYRISRNRQGFSIVSKYRIVR